MNHLGLCYPPCDPGYSRTLCSCISDTNAFNTYLSGCPGKIPGGRRDLEIFGAIGNAIDSINPFSRKLVTKTRRLIKKQETRDLEGGCGDGMMNHLGLCYPPCDPGYSRTLCSCISDTNKLNTYLSGCPGKIPGGRKLSDNAHKKN